MVKWGIIGAGNIAHRFAASLKNEKDATLYAISGRNMITVFSYIMNVRIQHEQK